MVVVILTIAFEASQQLYYINRYNIQSGVQYSELFYNHAFRWIVWLVLSIPLILLSRKFVYQSNTDFRHWIITGLAIFGLIASNILIISAIAYFRYTDEGGVVGNLFWSEFVPFFTYQKLPIYSLGYISLMFILIFYFRNRDLTISVQEMGQLKEENQKLYTELHSRLNDKSQVLNIKIGNKQKIIPIQEIERIESNDYCVNIFPMTGRSYAMRISLKALESQLPKHFIRVHRQHIVNMDSVREFKPGSRSEVTLKNGLQLPVSKTKVSKIKDYLNELVVTN